MTEEERIALMWFRRYVKFNENTVDEDNLRTILALLDRPTMPNPADVPSEVWAEANETFHRFAYTIPGIEAAYRALYDWRTKPAEPKKQDAYGVEGGGTDWTVFASKRAALAYANNFPGSRIVHLREVCDE